MNTDHYFQTADAEFQRTIHHLKEEFSRLNIGRANVGLVEALKVEAYGADQPLKALANISVSDARTLTIQAWDKSVVSYIVKAIQNSDLHLHPVDDGNIIRIAFPPLTEERRKDLVKVVHRLAEEARISIRHARQDAHNGFKYLQQGKEIGEDDFHAADKRLQGKVNDINGQIDDMAKAKEQDIMTV